MLDDPSSVYQLREKMVPDLGLSTTFLNPLKSAIFGLLSALNMPQMYQTLYQKSTFF